MDHLVLAAPPSITRTAQPQTDRLISHQAYILVKNVMGSGASLKAGARKWSLMKPALIGNIGWIQQAQSFDAVRG